MDNYLGHKNKLHYGYCLFSLRRLIGSAMFGATFNLVKRVKIFGTVKDGSLEINSSALNNCFKYRNVFQNSVNALLKLFQKSQFFRNFV